MSPPPEGNGILFHLIFRSLPAVLNQRQEGALKAPPRVIRWEAGYAGQVTGHRSEHVHTSLSHIHIQGPFKTAVFN